MARDGTRPASGEAWTSSSLILDVQSRLMRPAIGSLCVLLACHPTAAFAEGTLYRNDGHGISVAIPAGLATCASTPDPDRGIDVLLDDSGTCEGGVPKRVVVIDAGPNAVGADRPAALERFFCRGGVPLPVPLIVTRALRPGDDACSYRRGNEIAVWVLRQRRAAGGPDGGINYEFGLASDARHYAFDLPTFRNLLVRISLSRPSSR